MRNLEPIFYLHICQGFRSCRTVGRLETHLGGQATDSGAVIFQLPYGTAKWPPIRRMLLQFSKMCKDIASSQLGLRDESFYRGTTGWLNGKLIAADQQSVGMDNDHKFA